MAARILVVDDVPDELELVQVLLRKHLPESELYQARGGKEGLRLAGKLLPDLILLDVKMPDLSGLEVCSRLKAASETKNIPVLLLSAAMVDADHILEGVNTGADGYLCKPFDGRELVAQVKALLRLKESQDLLRRQEDRLLRELNLRTATLQESEARFRTMFENSPDAIFVEDENGTVLDANRAACTLHDLSREELVGMNASALVPPEKRAVVAAMQKRWFQGIPCYIESVSRSRSGNDVPVEIRGNQIHYNGQSALLLQVRDISRRKRMEKALRDISQAVSSDMGLSFFYGLVQNLTQTLSMDYAFIGEFEDGTFDRVRTVAVAHRGEIADDFTYELKGTPCENVVNQRLCSYAENIRDHFPKDQLLAELGVESYIGTPLCDSSGNVVGLLSVMHTQPIEHTLLAESVLNICASRAAAELERKQATEDLWESEERYRSLTDDVLDTSSVGILIFDEEMRVVWVNQALEEYLGISRERLVGFDQHVLLDDVIQQAIAEPKDYVQRLKDARERDNHTERIECRVRPGPHRAERWLEHRSQPIRTGLYAGGHIEHYIDITEVKQLEEQLLQAQKMESVGRLAGGIAHDFNNLLTSILGFSRLLLDELADRERCRLDVEEIINAGERAAKLTSQLLAFGRRQIIDVKPVALNAVIGQMAHLLARTMTEEVELVTRLEEDLASVEADVGQVEQIIMNLAVNARDAMPDGGTLILRTATVRLDEDACHNMVHLSPGGYVLMSVKDNGTGMSKDVQEHAFEPFFTTKEVGKGTGLGLSTVYGIVHQFGGDVAIESKPGKGTEVRIYFPQIREPAPPSVRPAEDRLPVGRETILLVEDEDSVRNLTKRILTSQGYHVLQARLGDEAIEISDDHPDGIDLLLTDVVMPKMSGPNLAKRLNQDRPEMKVLYISGFAEESASQHGLRDKSSDLLLKPFRRENLVRKVREVLDR